MDNITQKILSVWNFLKGKRTYMIGACIFILGGAKALGWVDENTYQTLFTLLTAGAVAALRAAHKS